MWGRSSGEWAAAFAAYGVTNASLPNLSMQDLENINVEGAEMRAKMHGNISTVGTGHSPAKRQRFS